MGDDFWERVLGGFAGRPMPDNAAGRRSLAHRKAAQRWPAGSAVRQMHEAAASSDQRLALLGGADA